MWSLAMSSVQPDGVGAGKLRQDVSVLFDATTASVRFALWQTDLPIGWVESHPVIDDLLHRRSTRAQALANADAVPLVQLLSAQGCFAPEVRSCYSLHEAKELFDPLRSQWYADYYAHPAWNVIRQGQASRNGVLAWLIHNYHVSRAAGVAAARMAAMGPCADWRRFFEHDALDEYWHCDAYYSLDVPAMRDISRQAINTGMPLPASLAFEDHALQVAQTNPLGHVLIAYFQEASIAFEPDSQRFYEQVERSYGMQGLFAPWKRHMQIDIEHGHADGLAQLLNSERQVSADELQYAARDAWLACYFLRCALDDIVQANDNAGDADLRPPPATYRAATTPLDRTACADRAYLLHGLRRSAFRALGSARDHVHIIACGRLAQYLDRLAASEEPANPGNPWCVAVVNHMAEAAGDPATWVSLLNHAASRMPWLDIEPDPASANASTGQCAPSRLPSRLCQFDELLARLQTSVDRIPDDLLYR
jgi:hypothetical protein